MANPFDQFDSPAPASAPRQPRMPIDADAIRRGAQELGINPVDLATAISYETAGTFDPDKRGPTTKWGQHQGLIQFGEPQRARYGVRPGMTVAEQMPAVVSYLRDAGVQPGMGMLDVYSAINAGRVGRYNASDALAGGMPGTVADKVNFQMADHRAKAMRVLGEGGGGGLGGYPEAPSANPFEQDGGMPDLSAALSGPNPFDQFDGQAPPARPDFSNVSVDTAFSGGVRPNYAPAFDEGVSDPSSFGKIGLRALVGRVPELVANLVDLPGNMAGAIGDAMPGNSPTMTVMREAFGRGGEAIRDVGYERDMQAAGYGVPSVSGGQVLDAINPTADVPMMDRASRVGRFIPETLLASSPDMAAAVGALPAYLAARTNEVAENRAANDQRANPSVSDLAIAAPAATAESLLERLTTMRLLPGGGAIARPGVAGAAGRVAKETGIQGASGAVEEAIPYLAETLGTEAPTTGRGLAEALATGLVAEGGLGGAAQGGAEVASAVTRPRTAAFPSDPVNIADIVEQAKAILPAVAAEGSASPRQGDAPAAPPTTPPAEKQEAAAPEAPPAQVAPDMSAATRAIDNRLAALDETAGQQIDEAEVSALNAERQELDDLVREQDRARREGIVQPLEARLSPEERATADSRRQEIAATLERHRAARTAADQAQRLRTRLEATDTDAALYEVAREIDPTLGTPQAESFRAAPAAQRAPDTVLGARAEPAAQAPGAVPDAQATSRTEPAAPEPVPSNIGTGRNVANVGEQSAQGAQNVGELQQAVPTSAPATATPSVPAPVATVREAAPPATTEAPRAEAQRQPAAEPMPQGQTGVRNAVTDAERVAEGRDPIIREARKANRETVDEAVQALRDTPTLGRETANRLASGGPVELKDEAVLLVHKVDLRKRRDAAAERAQSPDLSEEARATARREYDDLVQQIDEVDQAAVRVGTESGRLLQLRRRMIAEDYSLPALERKLRMVVNRDLKPGELAELKEMADKVADLQRKLDAAESKQAGAQVAEMLARLMKGSPGRGASLEQRRTAAAESRAALSAMTQATRGGQRSVATPAGKPGQARDALADRLGRGVVRQLERDGVLKFEGPAGGSWDGATIRIGDVNPENALGVLLHEAAHARLSEVLGAKAYDTALRDLDALEAAGDATALRAKKRVQKHQDVQNVEGAWLDDERLAYMVEEAAEANRTTGGVSAKARELVRRVLSAFRQWAATSPVFRALERIGAPRPTLQPEDFVAFAQASLRRLMEDASRPESRRLRGKIGALETELRTDDLTGMRNKRALEEDEYLGWPTVAAMDMDGMKKLNTAVGHETADKVLKALAETFKAAETDGIRFYRRSGDEFAARFRDPADAERVMADLQRQLEETNVELDVTGPDGRTRSFTYEGIGISYGLGADYELADQQAYGQKAERQASGVRQANEDPRPSRRLREDTPRPGGRRAGDPAAEVGAQRSIPDTGAPVPAGVDPVAFFHLARMGAFNYADGAKDQAEWTRRMQADLGPAAAQYLDALPAAFEAAKAQTSRPVRGAETLAEAVEAIGDKRRPRDVKRVVRAAVADGMRGEGEVFQAAAQALDMDEADVRALFVQPEAGPKTLSEAQAEINRLRKALRDAERPDAETRYQNQRARDFERRIAELQQRIADGDFAKRERVERELSKENERLRFELDKAKERFHQRAIEAEFEQRSPLGKIFGETIAGINFARAIMTSVDLSGVFRQGGFITLGNPTRAAKAVPDMLRAFVSERADFRAREELQNRPNAPLYKKAGLQLTGIGGDALSRVEEAYASRWVDKWSKWAGGGIIRGSGRSYTAFLNRLRADSFDAMVAALARDGSNPTTEEIKAIANYVNVATGRGKIGKSENVGEALTALFFAPRLVASRFQLLAGQPLYGGSNRTRKMIAQEYARFLIGVTVAIGLAAMMRDEDDETKVIEMDPRSTNFGKVRFGDTYLDPLAGLAQVTVFLSRITAGEQLGDVGAAQAEQMAAEGVATGLRDRGLTPLRDTDRLSDVVPSLGRGYTLGEVEYRGKTSLGELGRFLRTKLAPVPGALLTQVFANQKNPIGEKETPLETAAGLVTPMSVGNLVDVMEAHGMARGTAINLLGILGMSVQYRKGDAEKAAEEQNGIPGMIGVGTAEDLE